MENTDETKEITTERQSSSLTKEEEIKIVFDFFSGVDKKEISKDNDLPIAEINKLIKKHRCSSTRDVSYKKFELVKARETSKISEIKNRIYDLVERTITDVESKADVSDRLSDFSRLRDMLGKMDEIQRLNNNESTANIKTDTTTKIVDINEILKQLPSQEDKLRFLQQRAENDRGGNKNS